MTLLNDLKTFVETAAPKAVVKQKGLLINKQGNPGYDVLASDAATSAYVRRLGYRFNIKPLYTGSHGAIAVELVALKKTPITGKQLATKAEQLGKFLKSKVSKDLRTAPVSVTIHGKTLQGIIVAYAENDWLQLGERVWMERSLNVITKTMTRIAP